MPRAKAGLGRTGSKHKKVSQFNIHRDIKGVDDVFKQEAPSNLVPDESTPESAKSASVVPLSSLSASASNLSFNQYREPAGKSDYSSEGSGEDDSEHDSTASHAGCPPMPSLPEQSAQPSSAPSQLKPSPAPQPKRPPRKTAYAGRRHWHTGVKRLYGSKEAVEAINAAVECEYSAWWADAPDSGDEVEEEEARKEAAEERYYAALTAIKEAFPSRVCCPYFEIGGCKHGLSCECMDKRPRAPWPWIVTDGGGLFCDCHMTERPYWVCEASQGKQVYDGPDSYLEVITTWAGRHDQEPA